MKLTPELIAQAPSALNPLKERQLDLRGTCRFSFGPRLPNAENRLGQLQVTKSLQSKILVSPRSDNIAFSTSIFTGHLTVDSPSHFCRTNTMPSISQTMPLSHSGTYP